MRLSASTSLLLFAASVTSVFASPVRPAKRAEIKCPDVDDEGSPLTESSLAPEEGFVICTYKTAGECTFFGADGSFSSGASTCPQGLPQDKDFEEATGTSTANAKETGSSSENKNKNKESSSSKNEESSSSSSEYKSTSEYERTTTSEYERTSSTSEYKSTSTTSEYERTSTTTSYNSYQTSNYGSGSNYWGGSGYEDCVNQCIAQFGGETGGGYYQATQTSGSYGSKGNGATHTVIVAPHKGVFRMVPFATNASVGDTIEFHWGADQHTVTKSSQLLPCNKSAADPVFASGEQDTGFVYTQVVNDTNPTYYFCGTGTHCKQGMFGVINPAMAAPGSPNSLGGMMSSMASSDSDLSAYAAYSSNITGNNEAAAKWGQNFDMSAIPDWAKPLYLTNVLFTRGVIGMNADILKPGNSIDLQSVTANPLMLPMDITEPLDAAAAAAAPAAGSSDTASSSDAAKTAQASAPTASKPSGAAALTSPRVLVAAAVVVATVFAL